MPESAQSSECSTGTAWEQYIFDRLLLVLESRLELAIGQVVMVNAEGRVNNK